MCAPSSGLPGLARRYLNRRPEKEIEFCCLKKRAAREAVCDATDAEGLTVCLIMPCLACLQANVRSNDTPSSHGTGAKGGLNRWMVLSHLADTIDGANADQVSVLKML